MALALAAVLVLVCHLAGRIMNVNTEHILTLAQLARRLPARRLGRPVHVSTLHRWRNTGVRGVRLECVRIGGMWHTSLEAYQRWVERLTAAAAPDEPDTRPPRRRPCETSTTRRSSDSSTTPVSGTEAQEKHERRGPADQALDQALNQADI